MEPKHNEDDRSGIISRLGECIAARAQLTAFARECDRTAGDCGTNLQR